MCVSRVRFLSKFYWNKSTHLGHFHFISFHFISSHFFSKSCLLRECFTYMLAINTPRARPFCLPQILRYIHIISTTNEQNHHTPTPFSPAQSSKSVLVIRRTCLRIGLFYVSAQQRGGGGWWVGYGIFFRGIGDWGLGIGDCMAYGLWAPF